MKQRGIALVAYLLIGLGVLGFLAGLYAKIRHDGFKAGAAEKQEEWDREKAAVQKQLARLKAERDALLKDSSTQLAAANTAARSWEDKWKSEVRRASTENRRLSFCMDQVTGSSARTGSDAVDGNSPAGDGGVRLSWRFVGLYDGIYTNQTGQPLFRASSDFAGAPERTDTPSPYRLTDLLDVHGENAKRHSACIRDLNKVMDRIEALEEQWNRN